MLRETKPQLYRLGLNRLLIQSCTKCAFCQQFHLFRCEFMYEVSLLPTMSFLFAEDMCNVNPVATMSIHAVQCKFFCQQCQFFLHELLHSVNDSTATSIHLWWTGNGNIV